MSTTTMCSETSQDIEVQTILGKANQIHLVSNSKIKHFH
jgi:hypothetical protein